MKRSREYDSQRKSSGKKTRPSTEPDTGRYAALREVLRKSPAAKRVSSNSTTLLYKPRTLVDRHAPIEKPRVVPANERNDIKPMAANAQLTFDFHQNRQKTSTLRSAESRVTDFVDESSILAVDESDEMRQLLKEAGLLDSPVTSVNTTTNTTWPLYKDMGENHVAVKARDAFLSLQSLKGLWPTQKEGIDFMLERERTKSGGFPGGLIADDMGLGKTLQFLQLVLTDSQTLCRNTGSPYGHLTLVVMEKGLVDTWKRQMSEHYDKRAFVVAYLCHENHSAPSVAENITPEALRARYTLAITTYPVLVAAFTSIQRQKDDPKAKLAPYAKALFSTIWNRVLAEEAHVASNSNSVRFHALCSLQAHFRWAQTGTPVLNDVNSVCSLLYFIGGPDTIAAPTLDFTARRQRVSGTAAAMRIERQSEEQHHIDLMNLLDVRATLQEVMLRRRQHLHPVRSTVALVDFETRAETDLYAHYFRIFVEHCRNCIAVSGSSSSSSGSSSQDSEDEIEPGEIDDTGVLQEPEEEAPVKGKLQMVSVDILRLRQLCAAPIVVRNLSLPEHLLLDAGFPLEQRNDANTQARILGSAHVPSLAYLCASRLLLARDPVEVAFLDRVENIPQNNLDMDLEWIRRELASTTLMTQSLLKPSNTARLREILRHIRARIMPSIGTKVRMLVRRYLHGPGRDDKFIIFSDWVRVLEHIQSVFDSVGLGSVTITGKQTTDDRNKILANFSSRDNLRGLLGSLQVVANGLNIECANHATVVGPWWNPQTERQGEHRIRRPGQQKPCYSYNIIIRGTVEEDVRRMASEKEQIARILLEDDEETKKLIERLLQSANTMADVSEHHVLQELMQHALRKYKGSH